jgi:hypothetical protein
MSEDVCPRRSECATEYRTVEGEVEKRAVGVV